MERLRRWAALVLWVLFASIAAGQTNGIFADFTTSLGNFTCQLDYTNAPRTSANFIGLATGQRPWLDLTTGRVRTNAFYNGLTFHRVIADFMDQGGSPNGLGTDGPGYVIMDEFTPQLVFTNSGVLAMANSGPSSAGSQFFITVTPFTSGNGIYTIFGKLVSGSNVVYAINHVATDANNKPLTNVVMQQVSIRRVGTAAQAFNIDAQGLPVVTNLPLAIAAATNQITLTFSNRLYADNQLYMATNLMGAWTAKPLGIEIAPPVTNIVEQPKDAPQRFYALAQAQYPSSTLAPKNVYRRTLTLNFAVGLAGSMTINFDSTGSGTYTLTSFPPGVVFGYSWIQQAYRGLIYPAYFSGLVPMTSQLNFTNHTGGTFTGAFYGATNQVNVAGSFGLTGP